MASTMKRRGAKSDKKVYSIKEIKKMVENPPEEVVKTYRLLLTRLNKGLPRATSGEVLNSRVKW